MKSKRFVVMMVVFVLFTFTSICFSAALGAGSSSSAAANGSSDKAASEATSAQSPLASGSVQASAGNLAFSHNLFRLSAGKLSLNISIDYSNAGVYDAVRADNKVAPTSILGLGWRYALEHVAVDHNGTKSTADDKWFYMDDMGGAHRIFEEPTTLKLYIQGLNNFIIESFTNTDGLVVGWKMVKPDGTIHYFGDYNEDGSLDNEDALGKTFRVGDAIGVFHSTSVPFYDKWYLKTIKHFNKLDSISIEYNNVKEIMGIDGTAISPELKATQAVYINSYKSSNGDEVEFSYSAKNGTDEYLC